MVARFAVLLLPIALVGIFAVAGGWATRLRRLPSLLLHAGVVSPPQMPAVILATRRLQSARTTGALGGLLACGLLVFLFQGGLEINVTAMLAGAVVGMVLAQWWVNRMPRTGRRSAPLVRRSLVDLVGFTPVVLLALTSLAAVVLDVFWVALRPSGSRVHAMPNGNTCVTPAVPSVAHHLLSWTVTAPVLLVAVGGASIILRRSLDPTLPGPADLALRAAAIRTALGCGILITGAHALAAAGSLDSFTGSRGCSTSGSTASVWSSVAVGLALFGTLLMLLWCIAAYVLAPARRPKSIVVPRAPEVVAVS